MKPMVTIAYCTQCRWLLRAAWMAQELLTSFEDEIGGVTLIPSSGGRFDIHCQDHLLWSRKERGRFPDIKEVKQLLRDRVAPEKDLGHSEKPADPSRVVLDPRLRGDDN